MIEDVYKAYADAIGKDTKVLTTLEKQQAYLNHILETAKQPRPVPFERMKMTCAYCGERKDWLHDFPSIIYAQCRVCWIKDQPKIRLEYLGFEFLWYDFWIGFFFNVKARILYFCPLPCHILKYKVITRKDLEKQYG